ncbi:MAG: hypothetical protein ACYCZY_05805 [Lacisediminihabitans sp.]
MSGDWVQRGDRKRKLIPTIARFLVAFTLIAGIAAMHGTLDSLVMEQTSSMEPVAGNGHSVATQQLATQQLATQLLATQQLATQQLATQQLAYVSADPRPSAAPTASAHGMHDVMHACVFVLAVASTLLPTHPGLWAGALVALLLVLIPTLRRPFLAVPGTDRSIALCILRI